MPTKNGLTRQAILRALRRNPNLLEKYSVRKIGLFGSYAKDSRTATSDIDLLVEFERPTYDNFIGLSRALKRLFGRKIEILTPYGLDSIRVKAIAEGIGSLSLMPKRGDADLCEDIREAIGRIEKYTRDLTFEAFLADTKTQDAGVRNLEMRR